MTGALGTAGGSELGIKLGPERLWWGPGGVSLQHDEDDYCVFPVGYGSQDEPNALVKKGYMDANTVRNVEGVAGIMAA